MALLFADSGGAPAQAPAQNPGGGLFGILPMIVIFGAFFYFMMYLPSKRERKRMADLLSGIKKNDHVVTTSGIYGVVTDVNKETNKVTVRIDESTGAKMRVELTAIARVLGDEPASDGASK
jgi:preprotein translocase subunit YajC